MGFKGSGLGLFSGGRQATEKLSKPGQVQDFERARADFRQVLQEELERPAATAGDITTNSPALLQQAHGRSWMLDDSHNECEPFFRTTHG